LGGDEGGRVWCLRKCDAGYTLPCGFGSPYVSRLVCEKCECFRGKCRYPVLRGLLENLVELVKVRMRVLTRRLKQVLFTNKRVTVVLLGSKFR
jgi:hypothetical protein